MTGRATAPLIPGCRLTDIESAPYALPLPLPQTHRREVLDAMLACAPR
jgi:hypothetical protein